MVTDYVNRDQYFQVDASNSDFSSIFQKIKYDLCINCSGAAIVSESLSNPLRDYYLNTVNVFKILEAIRKLQPSCKFINLSSAAVYGNPRQKPIKEDALPAPLSPYGLHKLQAEQICKEFWEFFNIKTCSLRIFSVYGPGLKKQLFWDLYHKAITGDPFTLYGTGNESRDFIYISDLLRAIEYVEEHSSFRGDLINIANGNEILIKDAAATFFSLFHQNVKYKFSGVKREEDPVNWLADISKIRSYGYHPIIDIKSGLKKYYEWIITHRFIKDSTY